MMENLNQSVFHHPVKAKILVPIINYGYIIENFGLSLRERCKSIKGASVSETESE